MIDCGEMHKMQGRICYKLTQEFILEQTQSTLPCHD
jgi:hypothetical protein